MSNLNKKAKRAVETKLNKLGVQHHFVEADNTIIITDEYGELNKTCITLYEDNEHYPHCLSNELHALNNSIEDKFEVNFECLWPGTFGICLEKY